MLDCSTLSSTIGSLAELIGTERGQLEARLRGFDFTNFRQAQADLVVDYEESVFREVAGALCKNLKFPIETVWFHATRVDRRTAFTIDGLLPLKTCIAEISDRVEGICRELGIAVRSGSVSFSYGVKQRRLDSQGPCASLLRDAAVNPGRSHRNFLESPEIVEDLAQRAAGERWREVLNVHAARTSPCVVAFKTLVNRDHVLRRALVYAHACLHPESDPLHWNTSFDGLGNAIPPNDIISVVWLDG